MFELAVTLSAGGSAAHAAEFVDPGIVIAAVLAARQRWLRSQFGSQRRFATRFISLEFVKQFQNCLLAAFRRGREIYFGPASHVLRQERIDQGIQLC
jgi:hypothetical protein